MEQESECLKKMKNGDLEARNELIERNMRLVAHVAKKYQNPEDEMEDLISIGTIGLIKAVETYKETPKRLQPLPMSMLRWAQATLRRR